MFTCSFSDAEILAVAEKLPTAPRLLVELSELMNDPDVESESIVGLLRQDPPLVAQIVRMANSAAYAPSQPVGSLERALSFMGFAEVHRLVGAVAGNQMADVGLSLYPTNGSKLRLHTLYVAVLMEEMAKWSGERPHSCYTIGLLRTIGMMAMQQLAPSPRIPSFSDSGETMLDVWEQKYWGTTNVEVAEKILLQWRLPAETASAIRHHYRPLGRHNPKIHLLSLAASAAAGDSYGIPGEEEYWKPCAENFEKAGFEMRHFQVISQKAKRTYDRLRVVVG
jgi:HD-like signal output (HDOD) protein